MSFKTTAYFWLSALVILLVSFLYATNYTATNSTQTTTSFELTLFKKIVTNCGLSDLLSVFGQLTATKRHHHHHQHHHQRRTSKYTCNGKKWNSGLISDYDVKLVLTVDLKGCAKFNSVQMAVDAVPDSSTTRTLIIIDSGTYRLDWVTLFLD